MKPDSYLWLPENAILDGVVETKLSKIAREWAAIWFANPEDTCVTLTRVPEETTRLCDGAIWSSKCQHAIVEVNSIERVGLVKAMLDIETLPEENSKNDDILLSSLIDESLESFCAILSNFIGENLEFGRNNPTKNESCNRDNVEYEGCVMRANGTKFVTFYLSNALCAGARKSRMNAVPRHTAVNPLSVGLQHQKITVGAFVGDTKITISDAKNLSLGDVLVLDTALEDVIELTVNDERVLGTGCQIGRTKNTLCLNTITMKQE